MVDFAASTCRLLIAFCIGAVAVGCGHVNHSTSKLIAGASGEVQEKAYIFDVTVPGQPRPHLWGFSTAPNSENRPVVLFVPGAGNPTFLGRQKSNGAHTCKTIKHHANVGSRLARAGFSSFAYNKRTCRAGQDHLCRNNAVNDVFAKGPVALAQDVDAACNMLQSELGIPTEKIILWTHGQGGQVVLASECGKRARLTMITSPLTDRVDLMLVRTLHHRAALLSNEAENAPEIMKKALKAKSVNLSNRAESFKATFLSIESDRFIETASFLGVPLTFWYGWRKSTEDIDMQLAKQRGRVILFQGQNDTNYSDEDVRNLLRFGKIKDVQLVKVPGADHYLIEKNRIAVGTSSLVVESIISAWEN